MLAMLVVASFVLQVPQPPPAPFKETAQLGVPFTVGTQMVVHGSNKEIDTGDQRILVLNSARLATNYPNMAENITAGAGEKLLVLRGTFGNPSTVVLPVGPSAFLSIRFFDGAGKGAFKYVGIYDPNTHQVVHANLRKGESIPFDCVVRVPAEFNEFRVGLYHQNRAKIAWYDLNPVLGTIASSFSPDGRLLLNAASARRDQRFDLDEFQMKVLGVSEPASVGGVAKGDRPLLVVSAEVTNTMLLPARWGWQYVTPELLMPNGATVAGNGDLIDKATDKTWSGDLAAGATMTAQFVFRPEQGQRPIAFRLTTLVSKRSIQVTF